MEVSGQPVGARSCVGRLGSSGSGPWSRRVYAMLRWAAATPSGLHPDPESPVRAASHQEPPARVKGNDSLCDLAALQPLSEVSSALPCSFPYWGGCSGQFCCRAIPMVAVRRSWRPRAQPSVRPRGGGKGHLPLPIRWAVPGRGTSEWVLLLSTLSEASLRTVRRVARLASYLWPRRLLSYNHVHAA